MSQTVNKPKTVAAAATTAGVAAAVTTTGGGASTAAVTGSTAAAAGAAAAAASTNSSGGGPSPLRRFFELLFMLVSALLVIFSWDTAVKKSEENEVLRAELRRAREDNKGSSDGDRSGTRCIVCLDNPREVLLKGCGHVCVCADCANRIRHETNRCPVCRKDIESIQSAYIS